MRTAILLLILSICIQCTSRKSITDKSSNDIKSIVENGKLNVIYRGVRNPLTIYMPNTDSIQVIGLGVSKFSENKYHISPGVGLKTEITIIGYRNGEKIIDKREFRILGIDHFYASIHRSFEKTTMSSTELAESKIEIHIPQFVWETPEVKSFDCKINTSEPIRNDGNKFGDLAIREFQNLKEGDSVLIENIKLVTDHPNVTRAPVKKLLVHIK